MPKIIISVKDNVADLFNDPRAEINAATAIRAFIETIKDSPHKDDFSLYQIATFEPGNGSVKQIEPVRLYSGHDVKVADSITPEMQKQDLKLAENC